MSLITPQIGGLLRGSAAGAQPLFDWNHSKDPLAFGHTWINGGLKVVQGGAFVFPRERLVNTDLTAWTADGSTTIDGPDTFSTASINEKISVAEGTHLVRPLEGQHVWAGVEMMLLTDPGADNTDFRFRYFDGAAVLFNIVRPLVLNEWVTFDPPEVVFGAGTALLLSIHKAVSSASQPLQVRLRNLFYCRVDNENKRAVLPGTGIVYAPPVTEISGTRGLEIQQADAANAINNMTLGAALGAGDAGGALPTGWTLSGPLTSEWTVTQLAARQHSITLRINHSAPSGNTIKLVMAVGLSVTIGAASLAQVYTRLHNDITVAGFELVVKMQGSGSEVRVPLGQTAENEPTLKTVPFTPGAGTTSATFDIEITLSAGQSIAADLTIAFPELLVGFAVAPAPLVASNGAAVTVPAQDVAEAALNGYSGPLSILLDSSLLDPRATNRYKLSIANPTGQDYARHTVSAGGISIITHALGGSAANHNTGVSQATDSVQREATSWEIGNRQSFVNGVRTNATAGAGLPSNLTRIRPGGNVTGASLTLHHAFVHAVTVLDRGMTRAEGEARTTLPNP